jgi:preprotein translocase subunit SecE
MSSETTGSSTMDKVKLVLALGVLVAGIAVFIVYEEQSELYRWLGVMVATAIAFVIALQTELGRSSWGFVLEARTEVRKVVWPTRKETMQMAMIVIVMVMIMALIMWLFDSMLGGIVKWLIG